MTRDDAVVELLGAGHFGRSEGYTDTHFSNGRRARRSAIHSTCKLSDEGLPSKTGIHKSSGDTTYIALLLPLPTIVAGLLSPRRP